MVDFGSYGSVIDRSSSGALQMVRESAIDCLIFYGINRTEMSPSLPGECTEEQGHIGKYRDRGSNP